MVGRNRLKLQRLPSYNRLKRRHFGRRVERERERERESGTVTCHVSFFSALAASLSGMCVLLGTFIACCVLLLDDVKS